MRRSKRDFVGPLRGTLPPLLVVATFQVSTVKTVPESLRVPLGEISRQLVCAALEAETKAPGLGAVEEWVMYHMFVKSVLDSATEGDKEASAEDIRRRLGRWRRGECNSLWVECMGRSKVRQEIRGQKARQRKTPKRPPSPDTIMKAAIRRATGYAREGAFNKALNTLQSTGLAEANEETLRCLRELHPLRAERPVVEHVGAAPRLTKDRVKEALFKFKKGTACGYSGVRVEHLQQFVEADGTGQFLTAFTQLCNRMASGELGASIQPFFGGAALTALIKKGGGHPADRCGGGIP